MKKIINYLRCSGIWITIIVNPYHWDLRWETFTYDELMKKEILDVQFLFLNIKIVIDDCDWDV